MDFSKVSFDAHWSDDEKVRQDERQNAIVYAALFGFTSTMLLISIVRTIITNPGNIPEEKEWDMSTDTSAGEENQAMLAASGSAGGAADQVGQD